jgi:hypothetical protein
MNRVGTTILALGFSVAAWPWAAFGALEVDSTSGLSTEQQRLVDELLASQHPYECCQDTIAVCLQQMPVCRLTSRLERAIRRMAIAGMSRTEIEYVLAQRRQSMASSRQKTRIALDQRFGAGEKSSSVVLALYACGRSELCAKLIPSLYNEVTSGRLKGKVRMYYRPFFPGDQEDAAACGRALVAAADQGMFWPYLLHLYQQRENFRLCMLKKWADIKGLDFDAFGLAYDSPKTTALLAASRQEGLANKVDTIPCAFIDGRKIEGEPSIETLLDLLEEEHERDTNQRPADD